MLVVPTSLVVVAACHEALAALPGERHGGTKAKIIICGNLTDVETRGNPVFVAQLWSSVRACGVSAYHRPSSVDTEGWSLLSPTSGAFLH